MAGGRLHHLDRPPGPPRCGGKPARRASPPCLLAAAGAPKFAAFSASTAGPAHDTCGPPHGPCTPAPRLCLLSAAAAAAVAGPHAGFKELASSRDALWQLRPPYLDVVVAKWMADPMQDQVTEKLGGSSGAKTWPAVSGGFSLARPPSALFPGLHLQRHTRASARQRGA